MHGSVMALFGHGAMSALSPLCGQYPKAGGGRVSGPLGPFLTPSDLGRSYLILIKTQYSKLDNLNLANVKWCGENSCGGLCMSSMTMLRFVRRSSAG